MIFSSPDQDNIWMQKALQEAQCALKENEVPVGAIIVYQSQIIASAHNQVIHKLDPTAHAEITAIQQAAFLLKNYRLLEAELFVTLEPCAMCMGAILQARIKRLIFACAEPKTGCCGSICDLSSSPILNHHTYINSGILAEESRNLLRTFFQRKRKNSAET